METTALVCTNKHRVYKHRFIITVLSESQIIDFVDLTDLHQTITSGPDIGLIELESCEGVVGKEVIINECIRIGNDGHWFVNRWEKEV